VIERIEFRGARRILADILRTIIVSKAADLYDDAVVCGDFTALWNTGRFEDIQVGKETPAGRRSWRVYRAMQNSA
jgi:outer membrane protein assembly factor BamA